MSDQDLSLPESENVQHGQQTVDDIDHRADTNKHIRRGNAKFLNFLPQFWHDRLIEAGLILSMVLYCIIGNTNLGKGELFHIAPLASSPFLLIFAVLCWYRLPFALALIPLALPYYQLQKTIYSHYDFSPAEIALWTCVVIALLQIIVQRHSWPYWLSWNELRSRLGPFIIPLAVFLAAAAFSIVIAYNREDAQRAFREEVLAPLFFLVLTLYCLRSRQDLLRLLAALLGSAFIITLFGLAQYTLFRNQLILEEGSANLRVHATYGSANSIGLFFDYTLPLGLAFILMQGRKLHPILGTWWCRLLAIVLILPMLLVLYLTQSGGAWGAIAIALLFILICLIRSRKVLLGGSIVAIVLLGLVLLLFHRQITNYVFERHTSAQGVSTVTKRIYLWQSALHMIEDSPFVGYGMDNWLCHFSRNPVCFTPNLYHYWITTVPGTTTPTGLKSEPDLSHPHNVFLHVWVSMGIFGLLAFVAVLVLFFWLFVRILRRLRLNNSADDPLLLWMTIGVGAGMVASLVQGLVDSSFLEQDLAFCFWMLVSALLLLRVLSKTIYPMSR